MAQAVAWIGQDGNLYYGSGVEGSGVQNMGRWEGNYEQAAGGIRSTNFNTPLGQGSGFMQNVQMIDDPMVKQSAPTGGSGSSRPALNQAAVDATNMSLDSLGGILARALSNAQTGYRNITDRYNTEEALQREQYDKGTLSNMQNYDSNLAASLRAGRSGLSGLMAALRGGGGSGNQFARDWVQNTVADTTSNDIREGYTTFDENRGELDNSLNTFLTDLKGKRQQNKDVFENNKRAARLYDAEQRQSLFQKLADLYSDGGRYAESANYLTKAGRQAPIIAQNMGAKVSRYDTSPVKVQSADITAFAAPEDQPMTATDERSGRGSGIFSLTDPRRRERREQLAGV